MDIARSGIAWLIAKVLALGSSWIAAMYFARALANPTITLGQFYLFETVVSFVMLTSNAGINGAIRKRVSERETESEYIATGAVLSGTVLVVVTILVSLASPLLVEYFGAGGLGVLFVIGMLWALQIRNTASSILEGYSLVGRSGGINLFDTVSRVILQITFVFFGFGLFGLLGGALAGASLASIVAVVVLAMGVPLPRLSEVRDLISRERVMDMISYAKYILFTGFSTKFYDNVDILVITAFLGSAATGIYGIGFRFSLILNVISGAITTSSLPEISFHSAEGNIERVKEILTDAIIFATLLTVPATVGMLIIAEPLIVTVYTGKFRDAAIIATIAIAIQIPDGIRSVFSSTMDAVDRPDVTFRSGVIIMVTNGILDMVLVPTVGIIGAVIASFAGVSLATIYLGYHLFQELDLSLLAFPIRPVFAEVVAALTMGIVVWRLKVFLALPTVWLLVILILVGVGVYFITLLTISPGVRNRLKGIVEGFVV